MKESHPSEADRLLNSSILPCKVEIEDGQFYTSAFTTRTRVSATAILCSVLSVIATSACIFGYFHESYGVEHEFDVVENTMSKLQVVRNAIPVLQPLSTLDPKNAYCRHTERPETTQPGDVWGTLKQDSSDLLTSLPTNAWWQNIVVGFPTQNRPENGIVQLPYAIDTAGDISGVRVHFPRVFAGSDLIVMTQFDWRHAFQLGTAINTTDHVALEPGPLSITLQWNEISNGVVNDSKYMRTPIVRGSPFMTMEYSDIEPMIMLRQEITKFLVDGQPYTCSPDGVLITIQEEAEMVFSGYASSDNTWLVFVSKPTEFLCTMEFVEERGDPPTPGAVGPLLVMPRFILEATSPMEDGGVIRAALSNNCTMGTNAANCDYGSARNNSEYATLLREHAMIYPTGESRVSYSSSNLDWIIEEKALGSARLSIDSDVTRNVEIDENLEQGTLQFIWGTQRMDQGRQSYDMVAGEESGSETTLENEELLMFSLPHHREILQGPQLTAGGTPTLHGFANLVVGDMWTMHVDLPTVSFQGSNQIREEMMDDIHTALDHDIDFQLPENYLKGAGDTYFSGKMLAKMGRIAIIAEQMGRHDDAMIVANRLAEAAQVWLNGTAQSPLLYDYKWGGVIACGCDFNGDTQGCNNNADAGECPGLADVGQNFGAGFYNDHHFHYGYHIYAAAVIAKFLPDWAEKYYESVLLLVRDIANPSPSDPFFPMFRHKDWYLGSSWALGIATLGGVPYSNGRNQESSSEAVNSYEAVALYGNEMAKLFENKGDMARANTASHVRDTGRMLVAMEIRSAQLYWQVKAIDTPGTIRIYPEGYRGKVVGMLWSALAQMQTWFGTEAWKVFGIQMLPITGASERLLDPIWIEQMLPDFENSCLYDYINPIKQCVDDGWSMLVHSAQAILGRWEEARDGIIALPDSAFLGAGGDGHSRSNMLWFIATRP